MRRTPFLALGATAALLTLGACGSGADEFCTTLTDESSTAAVAFTPVIPGMNASEDVQARLDLVIAAEEHVPEDLAADLSTWKDYLEGAVEDLDSDPGAVVEEGNSAEVSAAGDALSEYYTGTCMD